MLYAVYWVLVNCGLQEEVSVCRAPVLYSLPIAGRIHFSSGFFYRETEIASIVSWHWFFFFKCMFVIIGRCTSSINCIIHLTLIFGWRLDVTYVTRFDESNTVTRNCGGNLRLLLNN